MILKYSIGIDCSKSDLATCVGVIDSKQSFKINSTHSFKNTKTGFKSLAKWIEKWHKDKTIPLVICVEATGVYHEKMTFALDDLGYKVSVVLPNKAKKYLQSLGFKSKNDKIDSKGLAQMGAERNLPVWQKPNDTLMRLRSLTRYHETIQNDIIAENNRLHAEMTSARTNRFIIQAMKQSIRRLTQLKDNVLKEIEACLEENKELKERIDQITLIKGISLLSACTVISEHLGFELFTNYKQVTSYSGYDVIENQSGKHVGKTKISKQGNSHVRRILHMPSLAAIRSDPKMRSLSTRVYQRSGIKMKGVVAVQKKLLTTIYHMWKNKSNYTIDFQKEELEPSLPLLQKQQQETVNTNKPKRNKTEKNSKHKTSKPRTKEVQKKVAAVKAATQDGHPVSDHRMPSLPLQI